MAGKQLKKQFNNVSLGKKDVEFSYFKVAFAARASVDAEIEVNGADAVDPEKAVRDAAGDWFAHKGKDALGFGGNPFGGLNWTKSDGDPKSLKIVLQGQSAVSGAKLHVEFQLVDLTKVQGIKAEVHGKFLTYPHEKAVGKGSKIKLKITPDIDATATPNYKEIVKKAFEEVCEHYGKAKLLQTLGTQVLQAVAKCGVPEAADLVAGGEAGGEAVAIVGAGAAVATVVVVVVVVVLVAVAVKYYETKADVAKTKVLVGDIVSDAWMGWRAGLLRFSPPSGDVGQAAFQKGSEAWHKTIEKVRVQNKHASDKAIMEAVHKEMLKVANDKSHFPEIVKQTREQVWKQYSAKYKDENVRKQIWENINGKPDGFPG